MNEEGNMTCCDQNVRVVFGFGPQPVSEFQRLHLQVNAKEKK